MTTRSKSADVATRETTAGVPAFVLFPQLVDGRDISPEEFTTAVEAWLPGYSEWSHAA